MLDGFDPDDLDDIYVGCAEPRDEHGGNMARRIAVQLGLDGMPAATVNRFCASSVQTARMAFHAIKAGEGHAFVSAGVECVSRYTRLPLGRASTRRYPQSALRGGRARTVARPRRRNETWHDPRTDGELPDIYIAMGQTAENVATAYGVGRAEQDEFGVRSQNRAEKAIANGVFEREIVPVTLPDGTVVRTDDGPRAGHHARGRVGAQAGLPPRRDGHRRQLLPAERRGRRRGDHERRRAAELGLPPLARIVATGVSALSPEIMGLGPVEASAGRCSAPG